jgi:hypothetical protein
MEQNIPQLPADDRAAQRLMNGMPRRETVVLVIRFQEVLRTRK